MFSRLAAAYVRRRKQLDERKKEAFLRFRPGLENLEVRALMASVPVAVLHTFATPTNTDLTITHSSSVNLLTAAFDAENSAITSSVVGSPAHGTITSSGTDGAFVCNPNSWYTGLDSFTYKVTSNSVDSPLAEVRIAVGGVFGPRTNVDTIPLSSPLLTGSNSLDQELSLGQSLHYDSNSSNPHPIIAVDTSLLSGATVPTSIDATLTFNGTTGNTVTYSTVGLSAGDSLRFALAADASALATGRYAWSMDITAHYSLSTSTTTFSGYQNVVNRTSSEYGNGWWLNGLDQIVSSGSGALLVRGNGDTLWFHDNGSGYDPAPGDLGFSTLTHNGNGTFSLVDKFGNSQNFDSTGLLTSDIDQNGSTISFGYADHDSDAQADELDTITDPYSRDDTLSYTTGHVTTFTDFASHASTLGYSSGKLTSVTLTDPDAGGALAAPVWNYSYSATSGIVDLLSSQTDPLSHATNFIYTTASRRLSEIDTPIYGQFFTFTPIESVGLKSGTGNTLNKDVNPQGSYNDANLNLFKFRTDRFGAMTELGFYLAGASTDVTNITRDSNGQAVRILQPDPGSGRPETRLGYNAAGDQILVVQPDASQLRQGEKITFTISGVVV